MGVLTMARWGLMVDKSQHNAKVVPKVTKPSWSNFSLKPWCISNKITEHQMIYLTAPTIVYSRLLVSPKYFREELHIAHAFLQSGQWELYHGSFKLSLQRVGLEQLADILLRRTIISENVGLTEGVGSQHSCISLWHARNQCEQ
jgi:hypothetical protein